MFSKNQTTCGNMAVKKHNNDSVTVISGYEYVRYVEANVTNRQMASTLGVNNGIIIVVGFS